MFKKGDRVRVAGGESYHGFPIGSVVTLARVTWVAGSGIFTARGKDAYGDDIDQCIRADWVEPLDSQWGTDPHYPTHGEVAVNEDVMLEEFDQGGLKRMPDGTLESVHIPEEEKVIPYTATGIGGPVPKPKKLRFSVTWAGSEAVIRLQEEVRYRPMTCRDDGWDPILGYTRYVSRFGFFGRKRSPDRMQQLIAKAKAELLRDYDVAEKESGLV